MIHQERVFLFPDDAQDAASGVFHYDDGEDDGIPLVQAKFSNGFNQFIVFEFTDAAELEAFKSVMNDFFANAQIALESTSEKGL